MELVDEFNSVPYDSIVMNGWKRAVIPFFSYDNEARFKHLDVQPERTNCRMSAFILMKDSVTFRDTEIALSEIKDPQSRRPLTDEKDLQHYDRLYEGACFRSEICRRFCKRQLFMDEVKSIAMEEENMKIKIRDAERNDAAYLDELLTRLIHDETQYDSNLSGAYMISNNYCERIGLEGHKLLLGEAEGKIIGYLYGFVYQIPDMWEQPVAILDALFVDEKYRRMGCASMLFSEFKEFAIKNGACRIELKVLSENAKAMALYKRLSFRETKKYMSLDL